MSARGFDAIQSCEVGQPGISLEHLSSLLLSVLSYAGGSSVTSAFDHGFELFLNLFAVHLVLGYPSTRLSTRLTLPRGVFEHGKLLAQD